MSSSRLSKRNGAILVITAVVLVLLVMMAALTIDLGRLYVAKQRSQNVADAAALAGACFLDGTGPGMERASACAQTIALSNNTRNPNWTAENLSGGDGVTVTFPTSFTRDDGTVVSVNPGEAIQVECKVPVDYGFARVSGSTSGSPRAIAIVMRPMVHTLTYNFVPWVVADTTIWDTSTDPPSTSIDLGDSQTLKVRSVNDPDNFIGAGNFLCVSYPGENGAREYADRIEGNADPLTVDANTQISLYTKPGNMVGPTRNAVANRIAQDTVYTNDTTAWEDWKAGYDQSTGSYTDTPRIVITPIVHDPGGTLNGRSDLTVVGFAAFFIESQDSDGNVTGHFISATTYENVIRWGFGVIGNETNLFSRIQLVR